MDTLKRTGQQSEKPGRLQLAILEWQRQLLAQRVTRTDDQGNGQARAEAA